MSDVKVFVSFAQLFIVCLILVSFTSCASNDSDSQQNLSENGGLLSGVPCSAPCFSGITPGKTNFEQVGAILNKNGLLSDKNGSKLVCKNNIDFDNRKIMECQNGFWIGADAKTNFVDYISAKLTPRVSLDNVFGKYGYPNFIAVRLTSLPDYADNTAILFFDSIQMTVTLETSIESPYPVSASSVVVEVEYFEKNRYQQRWDDFHPIKWDGYRSYKLTQ
jgi:hypothetical protein